MDQQTLESLHLRLNSLELHAGTDNNATLVTQIGQLQAKVNKLYLQNPELGTLDKITRELNLEDRRKYVESRDVSNSEKQETILIKYPDIMKAYQNLMELSSMDIPQILAEMSGKINTKPILENKKALEALAANFHLLVVKNLVILEKFVSMVELEQKFWTNTQKRLQNVGRQISVMERKKELESKY